jgi:hypothetical protein
MALLPYSRIGRKPMLRGNVYGLVIALLSFAIAVVVTLQQVKQSGVRVELIIQPLPPPTELTDPGGGRRQEVTENAH